MGARFRLQASFGLPASQCGAICQAVITTMKTYGLIVADNGTDMFISGAHDVRWDNGKEEVYDLASDPGGLHRVGELVVREDVDGLLNLPRGVYVCKNPRLVRDRVRYEEARLGDRLGE